MRSDFYVYVLLDPRKPGDYRYGPLRFEYEPFYVGKGTKGRAESHLKQRLPSLVSAEQKICYRRRKINRILSEGIEPKIKRIKTNATEQVAFRLERRAILLIGRGSKGPLTNLTDGGEGSSGYEWSAESRQKISDSNKRVRQRLSEEDLRAWGFAISDAALRRTPEERESIRKKFRHAQLSMSPEAIARKDARVRKGVRRYRANLTEADKKVLSKSLSKALSKYWNNVCDDERSDRGAAIARGYAKKSKRSLARKNAKISDTIAQQHAAMSERAKRIRSYRVMCGVMLRNAGRSDDLVLKESLRRRGDRFYAKASNLKHKPGVLRERVRALL